MSGHELFLLLLLFGQDYLIRTAHSSGWADRLTLRAVSAGFRFNYGDFAVDNSYSAGGAKLNAVSTAGAFLKVNFRFRHF